MLNCVLTVIVEECKEVVEMRDHGDDTNDADDDSGDGDEDDDDVGEGVDDDSGEFDESTNVPADQGTTETSARLKGILDSGTCTEGVEENAQLTKFTH
nr:hypothetical transcript [Hymenolepis microstoma]CUU97589.1 hypothetical transcript [Hymenolepis microstoma]